MCMRRDCCHLRTYTTDHSYVSVPNFRGIVLHPRISEHRERRRKQFSSHRRKCPFTCGYLSSRRLSYSTYLSRRNYFAAVERWVLPLGETRRNERARRTLYHHHQQQRSALVIAFADRRFPTLRIYKHPRTGQQEHLSTPARVLRTHMPLLGCARTYAW